MTYKEIINVITSNNLDKYKTFVALSCWPSYEEYIGYHPKSKLDFDIFCDVCEDIWIHDEWLNYSLSLFADEVIEYYTVHKRLPNKISELNLYN